MGGNTNGRSWCAERAEGVRNNGHRNGQVLHEKARKLAKDSGENAIRKTAMTPNQKFAIALCVAWALLVAVKIALRR